MSKELKKIIEKLIVKNKINEIQDTEKDIIKHLGKDFIPKHIEGFFLKKDKIIIKTKTIEAKTELNIIKKNFNTTIILL